MSDVPPTNTSITTGDQPPSTTGLRIHVAIERTRSRPARSVWTRLLDLVEMAFRYVVQRHR